MHRSRPLCNRPPERRALPVVCDRHGRVGLRALGGGVYRDETGSDDTVGGILRARRGRRQDRRRRREGDLREWKVGRRPLTVGDVVQRNGKVSPAPSGSAARSALSRSGGKAATSESGGCPSDNGEAHLSAAAAAAVVRIAVEAMSALVGEAANRHARGRKLGDLHLLLERK